MIFLFKAHKADFTDVERKQRKRKDRKLTLIESSLFLLSLMVLMFSYLPWSHALLCSPNKALKAKLREVARTPVIEIWPIKGEILCLASSTWLWMSVIGVGHNVTTRLRKVNFRRPEGRMRQRMGSWEDVGDVESVRWGQLEIHKREPWINGERSRERKKGKQTGRDREKETGSKRGRGWQIKIDKESESHLRSAEKWGGGTNNRDSFTKTETERGM